MSVVQLRRRIPNETRALMDGRCFRGTWGFGPCYRRGSGGGEYRDGFEYLSCDALDVVPSSGPGQRG